MFRKGGGGGGNPLSVTLESVNIVFKHKFRPHFSFFILQFFVKTIKGSFLFKFTYNVFLEKDSDQLHVYRGMCAVSADPNHFRGTAGIIKEDLQM